MLPFCPFGSTAALVKQAARINASGIRPETGHRSFEMP